MTDCTSYQHSTVLLFHDENGVLRQSGYVLCSGWKDEVNPRLDTVDHCYRFMDYLPNGCKEKG